MSDSIDYKKYLDASLDDSIWKPFTYEDNIIFYDLIATMERAIENGSKAEKGRSLENLMTFIYNRFKFIDVIENHQKGDNQIDHYVNFIDGATPTFIHQNVGLTLIGESKNHKKSISVRDVANLDELLRSKNSKLGIFTSYKSFSKGQAKGLWTLAEGKRRKLAIAHNCVIIGFTLEELKSLTSNNFYTLLKQKFNNIVDEIADDDTDQDNSIPFHQNLFNNIKKAHDLKILSPEEFTNCKTLIIERYGLLEED